MSKPFGLSHADAYVLGFPSIEKVMQYTGLKDKNSKEIYEGDIVNLRYGNRLYLPDEEQEWIDTTRVCEFTPRGWTFRDPKADVGIASNRNMEGQDNCLEILGNIYENPELLSEHLNK